MKTKMICILLGVVAGFACKKETVVEPNQPTTEKICTTIGEFNTMMNDVALAVNRAVRANPTIRHLIKNEVTKCFDGDTEVLLRDLGHKEIISNEMSVTRANNGMTRVTDLLNYYFPDGETKTKVGVKTRAGNPNILEELTEMYPELQIAIYVHLDEWDPETYIPDVVVIPVDFNDENEDIILQGFGENDMLTYYRAGDEPSKPVIVIGLNDRKVFDSETFAPTSPINLIAENKTGGIQLTWDYPSISPYPIGYAVYRKNENTETVYYQIANLIGQFNKSYKDMTTAYHNNYSYYVVAYNIDNTSDYLYSPDSNHQNITYTPTVTGVRTFDVVLAGAKKTELRWQGQDSADNHTTVKIYRKQLGENTYSLIQTIVPDTNNYVRNYYIDETVTKFGSQVDYRIERFEANATSESSHDLIFVPYREPSVYSQVLLHQIAWTANIENHFWSGGPEFYIKVIGASTGGTTVNLRDQIKYEFTSSVYANAAGHTARINPAIELYKWAPVKGAANWYPAIGIYVMEYDYNPFADLALSLAATYNKKEKTEAGLSGNISGIVATFANGLLASSSQLKFDNPGERFGQVDLDYFDKDEQWLLFQNYGGKILISGNEPTQDFFDNMVIK